MNKLFIIIFALVFLIGCNKDQNPEPIDKDLVLKRVTRYKDGNTDQFYITDYFYDNQDRFIKTEASNYTDPTSKSITLIEYIGDLQMNITFFPGSAKYEIHFNDNGDPVTMNEDSLSYVYNDTGMIVTVKSDSETWTETYIIENGNATHFSEDPPNYSWDAQFDSNPNYMKSTGIMGGAGLLRLRNNANNVTHMVGNDGWQEDYIYEYNESGYPTFIKQTYSSTGSDWTSYSELEIAYY